MFKKTTLFFILIIACAEIWCQGLPKTSITLFELDKLDEKPLQNAKYLTGFNKKGYNNQPVFFDNHTLYITSDWKASGITDIVKLNLLREAVLKVTDTDESEFSPTATPDGRNFTSIAVPPGQIGKQPQFLWQYPLDRSNSGQAITYEFTNVGYHCWLSNNKVALFLVGEPHKLITYDIESKETAEIDNQIGRCLKKDINGHLVYVHKAGLNIWYLKSYNPLTGKKKIIGETRQKAEDFDILEDGSIVMAQGSKIYLLSKMGEWKILDDLSKYGINKVTRIAVNGNKIAFVHATY